MKIAHWLLTLCALTAACEGAASTDDSPSDASETSGGGSVTDARSDPDAGGGGGSPTGGTAPPADAAPAPADGPAPDAAVPDAAPLPDAFAPTFAEDCVRNAEGVCEVVEWETSETVHPVVSDHHTTLVAEASDGDYLMVIGGIESDNLGGAARVYGTVRRARLGANGAVDAFTDETPLPIPLAFHGQVVHGGFIYLFAGVTSDASGPAANTYAVVGKLEDGHVTDWNPSRMPREVRIHPSAVALAGRLVVIGGSGAEGAILDSVLVADIDADGKPGDFQNVPPMPTPRSHHSAVVANERLYVLGGFGEGGLPEPSILRAAQDADGRITGWDVIGQMEDAPWTASAVVHRGWVWLVGGGQGGNDDATFVDTVRAAPLQADGTLGPFEAVEAPLPKARSHVHQRPTHDGFIYSVGGRTFALDGLTSIDSVFVGRLW